MKAVVVDLDGTLLTINTFKSYILYVVKQACYKYRLDIIIALAFWVVLRKLRLVTHERMKYKILKHSEFFMNQKRLQNFVDIILPFLNRKIYDCALSYRRQGCYLCLSTAAPLSYASLIVQQLHFDGICASLMPSQVDSKCWRENVREIKCKNTLEYLSIRSLKLYVLMTDHYDDIPLLEIQKFKNIIVAPTERTITKLKERDIEFQIIA